MSNPDPNTLLNALRLSLATALPLRHVQRGLVDPAQADRAQLLAGLVCVVTQGGGQFANYLGREGQLGTAKVALLGFVLVEEDTEPVDVERAELALLHDLLGWTTAPSGIAQVLPQQWRQSEQLEHPFGWLMLTLDVRF